MVLTESLLGAPLLPHPGDAVTLSTLLVSPGDHHTRRCGGQVVTTSSWLTWGITGVMTNLDSILKSRDITLPTKVRLVKAMVFPVVMYGCEGWTVKKAECRRIDAFACGVGEDS